MSPPFFVPEVSAESVLPLWSVTELAFTKMLPPAPVPSALVKMPLSGPSIRTDCAEPDKPWIVMVPPAPDGIVGPDSSIPIVLPLLS